MTDFLHYHTAEALEALSDAELRALWELVPTERQRAYRAAYEREVRAAGAVGSDALELRVADELLRRYVEIALVPIGMRWARTPGRVQAAARQDDRLSAPEDDIQPKPAAPRRTVVLGGLLAVALLALLLMRGTGGDAEATPELSRTPPFAATPTALALEDQDSVIAGGESDRQTAYPVSLQVSQGSDPPRVWVVQQRRVGASEWRYDPNPDTASYVAGMAVSPVIGIPWSDDNALTFARIDADTTFTLIMNTGAVLRFAYAGRREVLRSETDIFRQVEPGLALLLIGETAADGLPTRTRTLIRAAYPPDQELTRGGELAGELVLPPVVAVPTLTPTASATPIPFADLNVQIIAVTVDEAAGIVTARLRLYNGGTQPLRMTPDDLWIAFGYVERPPGPRTPADGLAPFALLPGQAADLTVTWTWAGEPFGTLGVGGWVFGLEV